jgi:predicted DNA-binding transcriptional regulator AlpA
VTDPAPRCCYGEPMALDGLVWHCRICRAWRWAEPPTREPYLTGREVAALLGISQRQVWRYAEDGTLPPRETWRRSTIEPLKGKFPIKRVSVGPRCTACGTRETSRFSPNKHRPSGYAAQCRACNAARMRQVRALRKAS